MTWLWIILWLIGSFLLVGWAFVYLVGQGFGRRGPGALRGLAAAVFRPGQLIAGDRPLASFGAAWIVWFAVGVVLIVMAARVMP